jgi:hypothetical protein
VRPQSAKTKRRREIGLRKFHAQFISRDPLNNHNAARARSLAIFLYLFYWRAAVLKGVKKRVYISRTHIHRADC